MELKSRFRGFLPVVVDLETGGTLAHRNPILEMCILLPSWDGEKLSFEETRTWSVDPHPATQINEKSLEFVGIDIHDPARDAVEERLAMGQCLRMVRHAVKDAECTRAILTGHNAHFDLQFMKAATRRAGIKRDPFHLFSVIDTVSLCAVIYGQTVLQHVCREAKIEYDTNSAHSALYDATITAKLFAQIVNNSGFCLD